MFAHSHAGMAVISFAPTGRLEWARNNRPELRKAVTYVKRSGAVLVVAKLDHLPRSTVDCNLLKTSGIQFIACNNPHANARRRRLEEDDPMLDLGQPHPPESSHRRKVALRSSYPPGSSME